MLSICLLLRLNYLIQISNRIANKDRRIEPVKELIPGSNKFFKGRTWSKKYSKNIIRKLTQFFSADANPLLQQKTVINWKKKHENIPCCNICNCMKKRTLKQETIKSTLNIKRTLQRKNFYFIPHNNINPNIQTNRTGLNSNRPELRKTINNFTNLLEDE